VILAFSPCSDPREIDCTVRQMMWRGNSRAGPQTCEMHAACGAAVGYLASAGTAAVRAAPMRVGTNRRAGGATVRASRYRRRTARHATHTAQVSAERREPRVTGLTDISLREGPHRGAPRRRHAVADRRRANRRATAEVTNLSALPLPRSLWELRQYSRFVAVAGRQGSGSRALP